MSSSFRILSRLPRPTSTVRLYTTTPRALVNFGSSPAPPRLPEDEQKIFEDLQRRSTGAFSTPLSEEDAHPKDAAIADAAAESLSPQPARQRPQVNQSPQAESVVQVNEEDALNARIKAVGRGEELHPNIRRGAQPEFEGDRNPKTGETGGPKNEPLRWGGNVDWSYNGRVTDF